MHWAIVANPLNSMHSNETALAYRNELKQEFDSANGKTKSYTRA